MSLKRKLTSIILVFLLLFTLFTGCKAVAPAQKHKIGVATSDNIGMTQKIIEDIAKSAASDGKSITIVNAEGSAEVQASQIQSFIDEEYSVIVICPVDAIAIKTSIELAKASEIPVVVFEKKVEDDYISYYAGYDAFNQGKLAADAIIEADDGKENIIIEILGPKGDVNAQAMSKGFHDSIDNASNLKVIQLNSNWNVQSTYEGIKSLVRKTPTINAIYCSNSRLDKAIDEALNEIGLLKPSSSDDHIFRVSVGGSFNGYNSAIEKNVDLLLITGVDEISKNLYEAIITVSSKKDLTETSFITKTYPLGQDQVDINKDSIWGYTSKIE